MQEHKITYYKKERITVGLMHMCRNVRTVSINFVIGGTVLLHILDYGVHPTTSEHVTDTIQMHSPFLSNIDVISTYI